ncbi:MAG: DNA-binding response regulator [Thermoflexus sp.]|uniref:response regulator transcription factor n=1 Tax=Thermoflexus sp. TaxID=1969742 RepID=UPI0033262A3E
MLKGKAHRRIRVVLADDHPLVLEGLQAMLRAAADIEVVAAVTDGEDLIPVVAQARPDVVVLDLQMPGLSGWECLRRIREVSPGTRVLILTAFGDGEFIQMAIEQEADGFVLKTEPPQQTLTAIRQVAQGHLVFPQAARRWLRSRAPEGLAALTEREREILALVAQGLRNEQIARRLGLKLSTVKFHLQNIFQKLGVRNRTEAARFYLTARSGRPLDPSP